MSYLATRSYQGGFNFKLLVRNALIFGSITWAIAQFLPNNFNEYSALAGTLYFEYDTRVFVLLALIGVSSIYFALFVLLHLKEIKQIKSTLAFSR